MNLIILGDLQLSTSLSQTLTTNDAQLLLNKSSCVSTPKINNKLNRSIKWLTTITMPVNYVHTQHFVNISIYKIITSTKLLRKQKTASKKGIKNI